MGGRRADVKRASWGVGIKYGSYLRSVEFCGGGLPPEVGVPEGEGGVQAKAHTMYLVFTIRYSTRA